MACCNNKINKNYAPVAITAAKVKIGVFANDNCYFNCHNKWTE